MSLRLKGMFWMLAKHSIHNLVFPNLYFCHSNFENWMRICRRRRVCIPNQPFLIGERRWNSPVSLVLRGPTFGHIHTTKPAKLQAKRSLTSKRHTTKKSPPHRQYIYMLYTLSKNFNELQFETLHHHQNICSKSKKTKTRIGENRF